MADFNLDDYDVVEETATPTFVNGKTIDGRGSDTAGLVRYRYEHSNEVPSYAPQQTEARNYIKEFVGGTGAFVSALPHGIWTGAEVAGATITNHLKKIGLGYSYLLGIGDVEDKWFTDALNDTEKWDVASRDAVVELNKKNQEVNKKIGEFFGQKDSFFSDLGAGVGSVGAIIGMSYLTNNSTALGLIGLSQYGSLVGEQAEAGADMGTAINKAAGISSIVAALEGVGAKAVADGIVKKSIRKAIATSMREEGITEFLQQVVEEVPMSKMAGGVRDTTIKDMLMASGYAGLLGAVSGGITAGAGVGIQKGVGKAKEVATTKSIAKANEISYAQAKQFYQLGKNLEENPYAIRPELLEGSFKRQLSAGLKKAYGLDDKESESVYENIQSGIRGEESKTPLPDKIDPQFVQAMITTYKATQNETDINKFRSEVINELIDPLSSDGGSLDETLKLAKQSQEAMVQTYEEEVKSSLEDTIARNELVAPTEDEQMPPLYQLGDMQIDTTENPNLGRVLYQAEKAGKPIQTLNQLLDWTKGKLNVAEAEKIKTGVNAVYSQTYERLKGFGQDEKLADANARIRSAMAFSIANNYGVSVEEADTMLGGIVQQKASEFEGEGAKYQDIAKRINEIDVEEEAKGIKPYAQPTINIDGVERPTTNSEGNPIAKSEKSLRYFYDWFGDSKVVDEKGRPLVVYHGTDAVFDTFDKSKIGKNYLQSEGGFFFTDKKNKFGKINMPLYLSIKNPLIVSVSDYAIEYFDENRRDILKDADFGENDGVIVKSDEKNDKNMYLAFSPNQIKSVNNTGKFDISKDEIFLQENAGKPSRGAYYNNTVYLFETANESTFIHEMSHAYMDVLERLANSGNAQAQKDLAIIRKWLGRSGEFTTADWERFARGFEMYVREGKAPNEYLGEAGGVFDRFKNWLMNIYTGIKNLTTKNEKGVEEQVKINKQIKNFYDEMLGGVDIDSVLNSAKQNEQELSAIQEKLKRLADAQQRLAESKAKLVREMAEEVKPETTWANVKDWGKNVLESSTELPKNLLQSSYERLSKIDKRLGLLVQKVEQSQGLRLKRWSDNIKPFYESFNKLSADNKAKVQYFLLNQQWGDVEAIIGEESTNSIKDMLSTIYNEVKDSGVEIGYQENYFPRSVLDYDGLLEEMGLTHPSLRKEMEEAIGKDATPQEQAEWLDKHIMGFRGKASTSGNKNTKERKLDLISPSMAKYYKPSMETLVDYMGGMSKLLSMREAFGKDIEYKESKEGAEDSIGKIINNLFGEGKLSKKEIDEVRDVLSALYLPNGMGNKFLQAMRQYGYATKLSYSTTVRQFADIGMMMKVNGVLNTLDALFHPDQRITLESLGIDPLGEEFQTSKKEIGGQIASMATKIKGINWADALMKNAYLRGNYKKLQDLAKKPEEFHKKYDALFGEETDKLIKDLNENKVSEPVKVLLFHEISKIQPISRSAMPTAYLSNPNGRMFYMFKTFSLHRAEYMVSELAEDFRKKDLEKAGKDIMADVAVVGWEGLVEILIAFLKYGWAAFATESVLETFAGSGLGVFGLNKHQALQLSKGQVGDFFQQMVGVGTPIDDIGYMIRHYDDDDKLIRAFLPDMIVEPLLVGPKETKKKKK